jgi:membrane-associated phospholipid phosphatase
MFQTEIMIGLQAMRSDWLTWLMRQITSTGYYGFVAALIIAVMLGISLRKGFLLFQLFAWTGMASELCKGLFGLPRPFFVDSRVQCLEPTWDAVTALKAQGASGFFSLPPHSAVEAFRLRHLSFGFPSGHVSGSVAIWGGLAVLFRKRWLTWFAALFVCLVALTRLYLGVHFLGDVLGGAVLGGLMLLLAWRLVGDAGGQERFFAVARLGAGAVLPRLAYATAMFILPLLLFILAAIPPAPAGFFIGLNAALTLILRRDPLDEKAPLPVRATRVLLGCLVFLSLNWLLRQGSAWLAIPDGAWTRFISSALNCLLAFLVAVPLFLRLGLYKKESRAHDASL